MRYVIIRDDDTNALTQPECLELLYRPFLQRGWPVNLATIPCVAADTTTPDGQLEGYLRVQIERTTRGNKEASRTLPNLSLANIGSNPSALYGGQTGVLATTLERSIEPLVGSPPVSVSSISTWDEPRPRWERSNYVLPTRRENQQLPIGSNQLLVNYLLANPGYHIIQHGCHHDYLEFERSSRADISQRLDEGTRCLIEAGFPKPRAFVAPYDKLSRGSYAEVARRFRVISTGWFELRRLPLAWWPRYTTKKVLKRAHWRVGQTLLLSHPGCLLSFTRKTENTIDRIAEHIHQNQLTVLVTHWWEYFRDNRADEPFIDLLHRTADYLANQRDLKVISFDDLCDNPVPLT